MNTTLDAVAVAINSAGFLGCCVGGWLCGLAIAFAAEGISQAYRTRRAERRGHRREFIA